MRRSLVMSEQDRAVSQSVVFMELPVWLLVWISSNRRIYVLPGGYPNSY